MIYMICIVCNNLLNLFIFIKLLGLA